jgi:hypothetical protein
MDDYEFTCYYCDWQGSGKQVKMARVWIPGDSDGDLEPVCPNCGKSTLYLTGGGYDYTGQTNSTNE